MRRIVFTVLVVALVVAAAGCGGGKKNATTTTTTTATATTSALAALVALGNCPQLASLESSLVQTLAGTGGNVKQQIDAIKKEAARTPAAIRPDFETIANALGQVTGALKGVNLSQANEATVAKLMGQLNTPQVSAAVARISAWATKNCHA